MALLTKAELKTLLNQHIEPCISIYMHAHIAGPEIRQDPIRLKNRLSEARERLVELGWRDTDAEQLLQPAYELLDREYFWRHQREGLAVFIAPEFFQYYRLPLEFNEITVVGDRFHLKPIMPLLSGDGQFYLLAFSQNQVRLFRGSRYSISEIDVEDMPNSLAEALRYDDPEEQLRFHSSSQGGNVVAGHGSGVSNPRGNAPMYHGHGVGTTDAKENILRFCQKIDSELHSFLADEEAPLVLAAVDYLMPIYREANSYSHLLEEGVPGNPDLTKPEDLHADVWKIVEPHFRQSQQAAHETYKEMAGTGQASSNLQEVVPAAYDRRVDTLFINLDAHQWGQFDIETHQIKLHEEARPADSDLLDFAAVQTFVNGGKVFAVEKDELPEPEPLAAIFRYAI